MEKPEILLDIDAVLKGQGADPVIIANRNPGLLKIAQTALDMGMHLIHSNYFRNSGSILSIEHDEIMLENRTYIKSSKVSKLLCGAEMVEMVICTIGDELEILSADLFNSDPALALALDGLANAAVDCLMESICVDLEAEAQAEGFKTTIPISPGSAEWPLEIGQPFLFGAIKPDPAVIRLNDNFLMIPKKSSSFLVGVGKDISINGKTCDYCNARSTCRYRIRKNF